MQSGEVSCTRGGGSRTGERIAHPLNGGIGAARAAGGSHAQQAVAHPGGG